VPARFLAPVVIVAVNVVLGARFAVGVNVSEFPTVEYATRPATGVEPGPISEKVVELIVAGFISVLKVALTI